MLHVRWFLTIFVSFKPRIAKSALSDFKICSIWPDHPATRSIQHPFGKIAPKIQHMTFPIPDTLILIHTKYRIENFYFYYIFPKYFKHPINSIFILFRQQKSRAQHRKKNCFYLSHPLTFNQIKYQFSVFTNVHAGTSLNIWTIHALYNFLPFIFPPINIIWCHFKI